MPERTGTARGSAKKPAVKMDTNTFRDCRYARALGANRRRGDGGGRARERLRDERREGGGGGGRGGVTMYGLLRDDRETIWNDFETNTTIFDANIDECLMKVMHFSYLRAMDYV